MNNKDKTPKNDFNATIGNTVLCDGFLIPMTDFVIKQNYTTTLDTSQIDFYDKELKILSNIRNYAEFLKQPLKLEMFVPCDEDGNVFGEPEIYSQWVRENFNDELENEERINQCKDYHQAKEKVLFEGFEPYEDYECAKYEEIYIDEEVCDGKFTVEDLIKDAGKTKIKLSQTSLNAIFG